MSDQAGMLSGMMNLQVQLLQYHESKASDDEKWQALHAECLALTAKVKTALEGYEVTK